MHRNKCFHELWSFFRTILINCKFSWLLLCVLSCLFVHSLLHFNSKWFWCNFIYFNSKNKQSKKTKYSTWNIVGVFWIFKGKAFNLCVRSQGHTVHADEKQWWLTLLFFTRKIHRQLLFVELEKADILIWSFNLLPISRKYIACVCQHFVINWHKILSIWSTGSQQSEVFQKMPTFYQTINSLIYMRGEKKAIWGGES